MSQPRKKFPEHMRRYFVTLTQCANNPASPAVGCQGYTCPLWRCNGGYFDESGKEIDHKIERAHGGNDDISNLQVLCPCCHSFKTRKLWASKGIPTAYFDLGVRHMDLDDVKPSRPAKKDALHDVKMKSAPAPRVTKPKAAAAKPPAPAAQGKRSRVSPPAHDMNDVEMRDVSPEKPKAKKAKPRSKSSNSNSNSSSSDVILVSHRR